MDGMLEDSSLTLVFCVVYECGPPAADKVGLKLDHLHHCQLAGVCITPLKSTIILLALHILLICWTIFFCTAFTVVRHPVFCVCISQIDYISCSGFSLYSCVGQ